MLLLGLDAAADLKNFGYALGRLTHGSIELIASGTLDTPTRIDAVLTPALRSAERALIAIDAPLGWPAPLGAALAVHCAGDAISVQPNDLFRRKTDQIVRQVIGEAPTRQRFWQRIRVSHEPICLTAVAGTHRGAEDCWSMARARLSHAL